MYQLDPPVFHCSAHESAQGWRARLDIELTKRDNSTFIQCVSHEGPLRIQRPFYPEGRDVCHVYLLHPPGGMVTGDALNVCASLKNGAHVLFTTPSAGKIYRGNATERKQQQSVLLTVDPHSLVEWLPQETIVFSGARGELFTHVDLQGDGQVLLWDVVCLGRPASREIFDRGYLVQKLLLQRNGKTLYRERNAFAGGSELLSKNWGLAARPVAGTMLASCQLEENVLQQLREQLAEAVESGLMAVSQLPGLLLLRYIGPSAEECRRGFEQARSTLRPLMCGKTALQPRIWNT